MLDVFPAEIREVEEIKYEATKDEGRRTKDEDMDIRQMMKQAQKVQEQLARQAEELRVEGNAGGGMVTVVSNGSKQVLSLKIDPEVVSKDDVEMLQDLILAALNDAHRKVDDGDAEERRRDARRQDSGILELQIPDRSP